MKTSCKTCIAALALSLSVPAFAEGFVVSVGGGFTTNTSVGNVGTHADGQGAHGDLNVSGVQGSAVIDYAARVNAGNLATSATGQNASARGNLGGVQGFAQP